MRQGQLIMTGDPTAQQQFCQNEIDRAWRYHTSADSIFHSRLTSFVTSQSFLITGYMVSFYVHTPEFPERYSECLRWLVAFLGIIYSVSFYFVCNFLYRGMQRLKDNYLAGKSASDPVGDPIYKAYYFHRGRRKRGEGLLRHIIPRFLPIITGVFWLLLIAIDIFRIMGRWP
jgi:hypothetical protein